MITRFTATGAGCLTESPEGEYVRWDDELQAALAMAGFTQFLQDKLGTTGGFVQFADTLGGEATITVGNPLEPALNEAVGLLAALVVEANWNSVGPKLDTLAAARKFVIAHPLKAPVTIASSAETEGGEA
jgi:hypothetical protein